MLVAEGRVVLDREVGEWNDAALSLPGLQLALSTPSVAVDATRLPGGVRGDPANRMIVATVRSDIATRIADDRLVLQYSTDGHVEANRAGG